MNEIDALLGMGISEEEQLRMLANSLRGKQEAADFFALSTVPNIQKGAAAKQDAILGSAKEAGGLRRSLQDRKSREEEARQNREAQEEIARQNREAADARSRASIDAANARAEARLAASDPNRVKPRTDYVFNDPNDPLAGQTVIPGSETDLEMKEEAKKAELQKEASRQSLENVMDKVDKAIPKVGWFTTGLAGAAASKTKRPDRMALEGYINTIQSELGIGTLLAMKAASKTGATGFGALSEKELNLVVSKISSLDPDQDEETLLQNLNYIRDWAQRAYVDIDPELAAAMEEQARRSQ
jgi:hypothetical protein